MSVPPAPYCPDPECVEDECSEADPCCWGMGCRCTLVDCMTEDTGDVVDGREIHWCRDHKFEFVSHRRA